jgi:ubiquinone/menaquinone biosynthesis C-methylase UbiE
VNSPFAYLLHLQERQDALSRLYRALRPGGVLLLDMIHFPWFLKHYRPAQEAILTAPDGAMIRRVIQHHFDWHENIFTHTDIFYRNGQLLTTHSHRMAMLDPRTIRDLLEQSGFQEIRTYNSFGARQQERLRGGRMILTAQKPLDTVEP